MISSINLHVVVALLGLTARVFAKPIPPRSVPLSLQFNSNNTFQISVFEDLHFGENAWDYWGPQQDINSVKVMNAVLDAEAPELVVLNGDLITGENTFLENSTHYVDQIVAPLVERSLTWASTYGNHDSQFNLSRAAIFAREKLWSNSRTQISVAGDSAGVTNYFLPVYPYSCTGICAPELVLWFFDSRGGSQFQKKDSSGNDIPQEDWVDQSVVDWFLTQNNELMVQYNKTIPSLAFVHIPVNAALVAQQQQGISSTKQPGINDDKPLSQQGQGWCSSGTYGCTYGQQDVPFMKALVATKGLMAVVSGHDHGDTWCYKWNETLPTMDFSGNGLNLCFGQHSGYGGYGSWIRGARQLRVSQSGLADLNSLSVDTWIRLESGNVVGSVSLNATYGQDVYPKTPDDKTYCTTCEFSQRHEPELR